MNRRSATILAEPYLVAAPTGPMTINAKSIQVAVRFAFRMLILASFAAFGNPDFGRSFAALCSCPLLSASLPGSCGMKARSAGR